MMIPIREDSSELSAPLGNAAYKLTRDHTLNVLYLGASTTEGCGVPTTEYETKSWRALTTKWLRERYPAAAIHEANTAIGGFTSLMGNVRAAEFIGSGFSPDLVFIMLVGVNDHTMKMSPDDVGRYTESAVRQIYAANPYADIVMLTAANKSWLGGAFPDTVTSIRGVGEYYGLPGVNFQALIEEETGSTDPADWPRAPEGTLMKDVPAGTLFYDDVHPAAAGYALYAGWVTDFLRRELTASAYVPHVLYKPLYADLLTDVTLFRPTAIGAANPGKGTVTNDSGPYLINAGRYLLSAGQSAAVPFTGKAAGITFRGELSESGGTTVQLDGGAPKPLASYSALRSEALLYDGLPGGRHTLTVTAGSRALDIMCVFSAR